MGGIEIRHAQMADLSAITELYNHYVVHTAITFDVEPWTAEAREPWLAQFLGDDPRYQLLVAHDADGRLLGYAGTTRFRVKRAYDPTVETTVYLAQDAQGQGLGRTLMARLLDALQGADVHCLMAGITLPNPASLALHARFGFESVGVMREIGRKFDRYWDVAWLQRVM